jgi:NAD(P)H-flavin reductase
VITTLLPARRLLATTTAFVCGPEAMMRFAATDLAHHGVPPDRIFLSMERNMKCAVGVCGHCQFGPAFVCKDGPVLSYSRIAASLRIREV